jgi:surface antigen
VSSKALWTAIGGCVMACLALAPVLILLLGGQTATCGGGSGSGSVEGQRPSPQMEAWAAQAAQRTGVDEVLLLAMAYGETHWGQAARGIGQATAAAGLQGRDSDVDPAELAPAGEVAAALDRPQGINLGDWVNPVPVAGGEHAMGFAQFIPSTWRSTAGAHPKDGGGRWDPYNPLDALTLAGYYFQHILGEVSNDVHQALDSYGTGSAGWEAYQALKATWKATTTSPASCGGVQLLSGKWVTSPDVVADVQVGSTQGVKVPPARVFDWVADGVFPDGGFPHSTYPGGGLAPDQCTTWASYNVKLPDGATHLGNAGNWPQGLVQYGWSMVGGDQPAVGDLAIWGMGLGGTGHVGVVIAYSEDRTRVLVSEMNWVGPGVVDQRVVTPSSEGHFLGFVPPAGGG